MKILIIGEKPSIAKKIIEALSINQKFNKFGNYYESEDYVVSYCVGHLLKQKMPKDIDEKYTHWSLDNLPFNFDYIPLEVSESTKEQLETIKHLFKRTDIEEIVNACDADREGELIFRNLIEFLKPKNKKFSRMWIESVANNEIMLKQIKQRQPQEIYDNLYESAKARAYADYFLGLNSTQAMSVKFNKKLSIGRVITPTLRIVVDLEKRINNFVSTPFYKICCDTDKIENFGYVNPDLEDNRFLNKADAEKMIKKIGLGKALITKFERKEETESAPKLFSLSDLQIECSRKYRYSAQEVLDACQSLYETYGLTTYPRTSENMISKEMAEETPNILNCLSKVFAKPVANIRANNWSINNSCIAKKDIASHEALTPTQKKLTEDVYNSLSDRDRNVYNEIVLRFLANFYPKAVYDVINIEIERNEESFIKRNRVLKKLGFYELYDRELDEINDISLQEGQNLEIKNYNIIEGKTEPPKRLTEGALIKIMQSPMKYVDSKDDKKILEESGGLGTEATRAGIIENMKKYGFIELKKNVIYATSAGISLIDIIPSENIKSVPLTASFEHKLKAIKDGQFERNKFLKEINKIVEDFVKDVKECDGEGFNSPKQYDNEICKCPNCGSSIIEGKFGYGCSDWKNCKVQIYFNAIERLGGKKISKTQAKELLTNGETKKEVDLISKAGKPYKAKLIYSFNIKDKYPNNISIKFNK